MIQLKGWALALGASSGFGEATSLALARAGLNIFGVHLDRKATLGNVERIVSEIKGLGREAVFFNVNAADPEKRAEVVGQMERVLEERGEAGAVRVLLHSLAFGVPFGEDFTTQTVGPGKLTGLACEILRGTDVRGLVRPVAGDLDRIRRRLKFCLLLRCHPDAEHLRHPCLVLLRSADLRALRRHARQGAIL